MKCTNCGNQCTPLMKFPRYVAEVVFQDEFNTICEECSIDFEMVGGRVKPRQDLIEQGFVFPNFVKPA